MNCTDICTHTAHELAAEQWLISATQKGRRQLGGGVPPLKLPDRLVWLFACLLTCCSSQPVPLVHVGVVCTLWGRPRCSDDASKAPASLLLQWAHANAAQCVPREASVCVRACVPRAVVQTELGGSAVAGHVVWRQRPFRTQTRARHLHEQSARHNKSKQALEISQRSVWSAQCALTRAGARRVVCWGVPVPVGLSSP